MLVGYNMAIVDQLEPVENEISAANIKVIKGIHCACRLLLNAPIRKSAVCKAPVVLANDQANNNTIIVGSMVLKPLNMAFIDFSKDNVLVTKDKITATATPLAEAHNNAV